MKREKFTLIISGLILLFLAIKSKFLDIMPLICLILLLIISYLIRLKKTSFIYATIPYIYFVFGLVIENVFKGGLITLLMFVCVVSTVILLIDGFKFVFGLYNNKMHLKFKNLKLPSNQEYLVVKYLFGPLKSGYSNGIIWKKDSNIILQIESKEGIIEELILQEENINKIIMTDKMSTGSKNTIVGYEVDHTKSYMTGRITGNFERIKSLKLYKSYLIEIFLKDCQSIKLESYDDPSTVLG